MSTSSKSLSATIPRIGSLQAKIIKRLMVQERAMKKLGLSHLGHTRRELQEILDLLPSSVTARLNELVKVNAVSVGGTKYDHDTDRHVSVYKLTEKGQQWASTLT